MPAILTTSDDLVRLRFAYRPLLEIPYSYRVLMNPEYQSLHRRWVDESHQVLHDVELPYLDALIQPHGFIPDFLTPTPDANHLNLEDDLIGLLKTPDFVIRKNVQWLIQDAGETETRLFFMAHPREAVHKLADELRLYWRRTLDESWSRMVAALEGDILYRGRLLALDGPGSLLNDLHPTIAYQQGQLNVTPVCNHAHCPREISLRGDGIQLVPSNFLESGRAVQVTPEWQPMIVYKARGVGAHNRQTRASQSLELALGTGRARVLQTLVTPSTTGEVAYKLYISAATASQHLSRLTKAGLITPRRSGKRVYYHLTERGEQLIALFDRTF